MAALALGGCSFNQSVKALATDADPTLPDANTTSADADSTATDANNSGDPDAGPPPSLVDTGLVVRYFMDEATGGTAPLNLLDSAPTPLPAPIDYGGQASFTDENGNQGLQWDSAEVAGKAEVAFGATKLYDRLRPARTVTIEVVADIQNAGTNTEGSNIAGLRGGNPDFMLTVRGADIVFYRPFGSLGAIWADVNVQQRMVLHLVYDSTDPTSANRIELFKDGVLIPKTTSSPPAQNQTVGLGSLDSLMIGNNRNESRSIEGKIFYVAVYDQALSQADISTNTARLFADDDK